ncbi:MAG: deoxyribose-phosphate aldolase [Candidatus Sigynarchaeota archaeon]
MSARDIRAYIDHTILKPETTREQVIQVCNEAKEYRFAAVCVNPWFIPLVARCLKGTKIGAGAAIGFPLGTTTTDVKVFEAKDALRNGATELDMVINVGALKSGDPGLVEKEIASVVAAAKGKALVKVILETCLLTTDEIVAGCKLAMKARADFVKTSTGFSSAGATVEHVALMRKTVGDKMGVKASGGIRTYQAALDMIKAGATRIGTSAGVQIMKEQEGRK